MGEALVLSRLWESRQFSGVGSQNVVYSSLPPSKRSFYVLRFEWFSKNIMSFYPVLWSPMVYAYSTHSQMICFHLKENYNVIMNYVFLCALADKHTRNLVQINA